MSTQTPTARMPTILVSGDLTNDHHVYTGERFNALDLKGRGVVRRTMPGGVALLYRLLAKVYEAAPTGTAPATANVFSKIEFPATGNAETSWEGYALWEPCATAGKDGKEKRWRSIRGLGFGEQEDGHSTGMRLNKTRPSQPEVIVFDDLGLEFRHQKAEALWPLDALDEGAAPPWLVLKMAAPAAQGDLWWKLARDHADQLVVVTSVEDLRAAPARISRGSSWERTVEDLARELQSHPVLKELTRCRHLIVRCGKEGVYWRARTGPKPEDTRETLVFDPQRIEGEWMEELRQKQIDGRVFGMKAVLTAAVVHALGKSSGAGGPAVDLAPALRAGLDAIRTLQLEGHGKVGHCEPASDCGTGKKLLMAPGFPLDAVAGKIRGGGKGFDSLHPLQCQPR